VKPTSTPSTGTSPAAESTCPPGSSTATPSIQPSGS
jgi:hypothetical protein